MNMEVPLLKVFTLKERTQGVPTKLFYINIGVTILSIVELGMYSFLIVGVLFHFLLKFMTKDDEFLLEAVGKIPIKKFYL